MKSFLANAATLCVAPGTRKSFVSATCARPLCNLFIFKAFHTRGEGVPLITVNQEPTDTIASHYLQPIAPATPWCHNRH